MATAFEVTGLVLLLGGAAMVSPWLALALLGAALLCVGVVLDHDAIRVESP